MTKLWRIHLRPSSETGVDACLFCTRESVLGVGWAVGQGEQALDWQTYSSLAAIKHAGDRSWRLALTPLRTGLSIGDLCWSRDQKGIYYLGQVTGDWEYRSGEAYRRADIVNVRLCKWVEVGTVEEVPGKVLSSFVPRRILQPINDATALFYSEMVFGQKTGAEVIKSPEKKDVFALLSSEDCEDVVGLYLQSLGYSLIPSSCKRRDTLAYEYVFRHRTTGHRAVAQVKRGADDLVIDDLLGVADDVFLFTTHGKYLGAPTPRVHCIDRSTIEGFLRANPQILTQRIKTWVQAAGL
ncbi:MAG: hypothetical protein Q8R92_18980 [Deltaproteobacteria bacterium]|nr:hypothetical protein [Deltaproteobacteria bacterium]